MAFSWFSALLFSWLLCFLAYTWEGHVTFSGTSPVQCVVMRSTDVHSLSYGVLHWSAAGLDVVSSTCVIAASAYNIAVAAASCHRCRHHDRGATSDLLHDPRGLLVKLADSVSVTLDRASTTCIQYVDCYGISRIWPSYSEDTVAHINPSRLRRSRLIRRYLPRTRVISYTYSAAATLTQKNVKRRP